MPPLRTAARGLALLALCLCAARAHAQGPTAEVLPRGMLELRLMGFYTQWDTRFGPGGKQSFGAPFEAALSPIAERFTAPVVPPLADSLTRFFAFTQDSVGGAP